LIRPASLKITPADLVLVCGLAALAGLLAAPGGRGGAGGGAREAPICRAVIRNSAGEVLSVGIREDETLAVRGPRGTTLIAVGGGRLRFVDSPCPHKVCLDRGEISRPGEWIACVPNGVVATLEGECAYDGITP
jgi:hypothetical protein